MIDFDGGHEVALNQFADYTDAEYEQLLGFKPFNRGNGREYQPKREIETLTATDLPESINWVEQGKVTAIKDQGSCGSCWSFSTTGSIESAYKIKNGSEKLLSAQQLIDCSLDYGNNGCSGGLVEYAYNYAKHNALETEDEYPYKAKNQECQATVNAPDGV